MAKTLRAFVVCCIGCKASKVTLYKLHKDLKLCGDCRNIFNRKHVLDLYNGHRLIADIKERVLKIVPKEESKEGAE